MISGRRRLLRQSKLLDGARLSRASVAIAGLGGLGCAAATYLALAGIGKLFLIDRDVIEESNLNRQFLYSGKDVGRKKAELAGLRLSALAPKAETVPLVETSETALKGISPDVVLDCTDNIESRIGIGRTCAEKKIPVVFGSAEGWTGSIGVFLPGKACLSCFLGRWEGSGNWKERACRDLGIVGPVAGAVGALQAVEALKLVSSGRSLPGTGETGLRYFDFLSGKSWVVKVKKRRGCPVCGRKARFDMNIAAENGGLRLEGKVSGKPDVKCAR